MTKENVPPCKTEQEVKEGLERTREAFKNFLDGLQDDSVKSEILEQLNKHSEELKNEKK